MNLGNLPELNFDQEVKQPGLQGLPELDFEAEASEHIDAAGKLVAFPVPEAKLPIDNTDVEQLKLQYPDLPEQEIQAMAEQLEPVVEKKEKDDKNLLAYAPYLAVKAVQGIMGPTLKPLKTLGMDTENVLKVAAEYWRKKLPSVGVPNVGLAYDEEKGVSLEKLDDIPIADIIGATGEGVGFLGPASVALKAGGLITAKLTSQARPFYRAILKGMIGGALLGEGEKDRTLETMALFGVFEAGGFAIGKIPAAVKKVRDSTLYRKATIKERGLMVQSLEEVLKKNPNLSEAELVKKSDSYFKESLAKRTKGEEKPKPKEKEPEVTPEEVAAEMEDTINLDPKKAVKAFEAAKKKAVEKKKAVGKKTPTEIKIAPEQKTFVDTKVKELGSLEAVKKQYTNKDAVSQYARQQAAKAYGGDAELDKVTEIAEVKTGPYDVSTASFDSKKEAIKQMKIAGQRAGADPTEYKVFEKDDRWVFQRRELKFGKEKKEVKKTEEKKKSDDDIFLQEEGKDSSEYYIVRESSSDEYKWDIIEKETGSIVDQLTADEPPAEYANANLDKIFLATDKENKKAGLKVVKGGKKVEEIDELERFESFKGEKGEAKEVKKVEVKKEAPLPQILGKPGYKKGKVVPWTMKHYAEKAAVKKGKGWGVKEVKDGFVIQETSKVDLLPEKQSPVKQSIELLNDIKGVKNIKEPKGNIFTGLVVESRQEVPKEVEELKVVETEFTLDKTNLLPTLLKDIANQNPSKTMIYELMQNSLDAINIDGRVNVSFKDNNTTPGIAGELTFSDNGFGMSTEEVKKFFLVGGSIGKSGTTTRGGYGLAKIALLLIPKKIKLETVKNGIKSTVIATREQIYNGKITITPSRTNEPSGTSFVATLPYKINNSTISGYDITQAVEGVTKGTWSTADISYDLLSPVDNSVVRNTLFKAKNLANEPEKVRPESFSHKGSKVTIYHVKTEPYGMSWGGGDISINRMITNKGLIVDVRTGRLKGGSLPVQPDYEVIIDFEETPSVRDEDYPFLKNRTELREDFVDILDSILERVHDDIRNALVKERGANFGEMVKRSPEFDGIKVLIPYEGQAFADAMAIIKANADLIRAFSKLMKQFTTKLRYLGDSPTDFHITIDTGVFGYKSDKKLTGYDLYAINPFNISTRMSESTAFSQAVKAGEDTNRLQADMMVHTLVHAYSHVAEFNHAEGFAAEVARIYAAYGHKGLYKLSDRMRRFYEDFGERIEGITRDLEDISVHGEGLQDGVKGLPNRQLTKDGKRTVPAVEGLPKGEVEAIQAIVKTGKGIKQALPHLQQLGEKHYTGSKQKYFDWQAKMKASLGDLWAKVKNQVAAVWERVKVSDAIKSLLDPVKNQRGEVDISSLEKLFGKNPKAGTLLNQLKKTGVKNEDLKISGIEGALLGFKPTERVSGWKNLLSKIKGIHIEKTVLDQWVIEEGTENIYITPAKFPPNRYPTLTLDGDIKNYKETLFKYADQVEVGKSYSQFQEKHFDQQGWGVFATNRSHERSMVTGEKTIHGDEIQSVQAERGSAEGFKSEVKVDTEAVKALAVAKVKYEKYDEIESGIFHNWEEAGVTIKERSKLLTDQIFREENRTALKELYRINEDGGGFLSVRTSVTIRNFLNKDELRPGPIAKVVHEIADNAINTGINLKLDGEAGRFIDARIKKDDASVKIHELGAKSSGEGVPNMPFKKDWFKLVVRDMMNEAIEKDKDGISWSTAEILADRYGKFADKMTWEKRKRGHTVNFHDVGYKVEFYKDERSIGVQNRFKDLDEVGKFAGGKVRRTIEAQEKTGEITGGSHGNILVDANMFKRLYEEQIPKMVKAEYGVKAELRETEVGSSIPGGPMAGLESVGPARKNSEKVWFAPITPEVKAMNKVSILDSGPFRDILKVKGGEGTKLYSGLDPVEAVRLIVKTGKDIKAAIPHLQKLGESFYTGSKQRYFDWQKKMKSALGNAWEKVKKYIQEVWKSLKAAKPVMDERGSVTTKELSRALKRTGKFADRQLGALTTRAENIHPTIKNKLIEFELDSNTKIENLIRLALPFIKSTSKMTKFDYKNFDLARKNSNKKQIDIYLKKYPKVAGEYKQIRLLLDGLREYALKAGYKFNYLEEYHPREVKDFEGLMDYLHRKDKWSTIDLFLKAHAAKKKRSLTREEEINLVNSLFRGYADERITLSKPGQLKIRKLRKLTPEMNEFFGDSNSALLRYIADITIAVESRKIFGKGVDKKSELFNLNNTIGAYVLDLVKEKKLTPSQELELRSILKARFNPVGTSGIVTTIKNLSVIDVMGSPFSALRQVGDIAWSFIESGVIPTVKVFPRALVGKSEFTKESLGISKIGAEFSDKTTSAKAVDRVFRMIWLTKIDAIGKETLINASYDVAVRRAKSTNSKVVDKFWEELAPIFGKKTNELLKTFRDQGDSRDVRLYLLRKLSEYQPATLSELPQGFIEGGNFRIAYMLKSFDLKKFDVYRRKVFRQIATKGQRLSGLRNLIKIVFFLTLMEATGDMLQDLLRGKPVDFSDLFLNRLAHFAISRYTTRRIRREGLGKALMEQMLPPTQIVNSLSKDILTAGDEKGLETTKSIPLVGKIYYYRFGKGAERIQEERAEKKRSQNAIRIATPKVKAVRIKQVKVKAVKVKQ